MSHTIGSRIQLARVKNGQSREHVAAACGVTAQTVANWETDKTTPGLEHAEPLCAILGISASTLIYGREKRSA